MIYRVMNKKQVPVQLAIRSLDGQKTKLIVLPPKQSFDIPEERYSSQITALASKGDVVVTQVNQ